MNKTYKLLITGIEFEVNIQGFPQQDIKDFSRIFKEYFRFDAAGAARRIKLNIVKEPEYILGAQNFKRLLEKKKTGRFNPVMGQSVAIPVGCFMFVSEQKDMFYFFQSLYSQGLLIGCFQIALSCVYGDFLIDRGFMLFHAAGIAHRGKGYVFLAPSGGGKTTLSRLFRGGEVFSDDMIILQKQKEGCRMYSPFYFRPKFNDEILLDLKRSIEKEKSAWLSEVYFLEKHSAHEIVNEQTLSAVARAYAQLWCNNRRLRLKASLKKKYLCFLLDLFKIIPAKELKFKKNHGFLSLFQK